MSSQLTLILVFISSAIFAGLTITGWRHRQRRLALVRSLKDDGAISGRRHQRSKSSDRSMGERLRRMASGRSSSDALKMRLVRAGWDTRTSPLTFSALRLSLEVSFPLLAVVFTYAANRQPLEVLIAALAGFVLARMIPALIVRQRTRKRQKRIRRSLPDALDLMVVCVEAGVGLDAAILRVAEELRLTHRDLAHELHMVNRRVNAGISRPDALRELVNRTGVDDLRSVITTLIQSDKLGVSIGRVLRVASDGLRTRRRQRAEQEARKAPIRMLVPLVLFVLPALILVLMGPAAIHLVRVLKDVTP